MGYDVFSASDVEIPAKGKGTVFTDLTVLPPSGMYAQLLSRSGLAAKSHVTVEGGVIDPDYRGNVGVILFNHSLHPFFVKVGDRVAQMVMCHYSTPEVEKNHKFTRHPKR